MKTAKYYANVYKTGMVPLEEVIQTAMDACREDQKDVMTIYANQKMVEFVNWLNDNNKAGFYIPNNRIGQFSQREKDSPDS